MTGETRPGVALITGALSDIGQAAAKALAEAGYGIVLNHRRDAPKAKAVVDSLLRACPGSRVEAIRADVRDRREVAAMFDQACQVFGHVDVLVNNAGINRDRPFMELGDSDWQEVVDTLLNGTFICSQEYARRYRDTEGCIINIGSTTAIRGRLNGANYCSARAGVLTLTRCMALELAPRIRVNTVTPGPIDTEELRERYHLDDPEKRARMITDVPLKRMGTPAEVAAMIAFLATSGSYITGQNFFVDGGIYMR